MSSSVFDIRRFPVVTWNSGVRSFPSTTQAPPALRAANSATTGWPSFNANCARSSCCPSPCHVSVTPPLFAAARNPSAAL